MTKANTNANDNGAVDVDELDALLLDERDGTLDEPGRDRLRELLRTSEAARTHYVRMQTLTLALELENGATVEEDAATGTAVVTTAPAAPNPVRATRWLAVTAAAIGLLIVGRWAFLEWMRPPAPGDGGGPGMLARDASDEATATGVALVTRLVDVEWAADGEAYEVGDAVPPGRLALTAGFAQVEFFCGATVVLEGPAELVVESAEATRFLAGRLRAKVPPAARGFEVHVGEMTVVDLGTEFGLAVSPEGSDVQVFDGEVELRRPNADAERILGGRAVRHGGDGGLAETELLPDRFVDVAGLEERDRRRTRAGFERWQAHSAKLRTDPRLIAYYAFDTLEAWERRLPCSVEPRNEDLDGAIVGANHVPGRWMEKGALEFKRPGDRVKVQVPGEYGSLTLACWVRIDSLDRWYNSLFLTDHYEQGEPHWQILDTGQLFFSVRKNRPGDPGKWHREVLSEPFWEPSMSGKWLHIATTYDAETGRVAHYLDGELLGEETLPEEFRVETTRIGTASIGNWSAPTKPEAEFAIRNLNGRIDEFALFAAPLSHDEIREMYAHGKP